MQAHRQSGTLKEKNGLDPLGLSWPPLLPRASSSLLHRAARSLSPQHSEGGGPWTSNGDIPWELDGSQTLRAHPDLLKQNLHSNQPPGSSVRTSEPKGHGSSHLAGRGGAVPIPITPRLGFLGYQLGPRPPLSCPIFLTWSSALCQPPAGKQKSD